MDEYTIAVSNPDENIPIMRTVPGPIVSFRDDIIAGAVLDFVGSRHMFEVYLGFLKTLGYEATEVT